MQQVNKGWSYECVNTLTVFNDYIDRSTTGITFHRHNNERFQLPFLPIYYPSQIWRRKRVHLFPSKKYPYRTILSVNQNNKRYFPLRNLPGTKNIKWTNYMLSYKNLNQLLKTTPRTNYYMLSEENMNVNLHNREQYLSRPILSTISPLQNNCVNTYHLNTPHANICTEKMSTVQNIVPKISLNKAEYISNITQFETTTRNPYRQYFGPSTVNTYMYNIFHATTVPNSINTSHIYFTIGDAITTPGAINNSQFQKIKKHETENNGNQSIINYKMYRFHTATPVKWTMASNPVSLSQFSNDTAKYSISNNEMTNKSISLYTYNNSSIDSTKASWVIDKSVNNNCSNLLLQIKKCYTYKPNVKDIISNISLQTTRDPIGSYPIKTTVDSGTTSKPITELQYLDNTSSTAIWNVVEMSNYSSEKASIIDNTSHYPPIYRRGKIVQINKRLLYKESLKNKNRNSKTTASPISKRLSKPKAREKGKYVSSTLSPSLQTTPSTQIIEQELLQVTVSNNNVKKIKNRFQDRNRSRWTPSYEQRLGKLNNNVSTSSTLATLLSSSTQPIVPQRNKKTNKFTRSKLSRHNKITNILQMNTTRSAIELHLQSTTPLASSTPESAIMRISNISGVNMFLAKNNITNSLDNLPNASNAFIAELPIVTYFKEVTESRKLLTQFCESIITDVQFLGVEQQSCKKIFKFHDLEMGYCFLANNIMDYHNLDELPLRLSPFESQKSIKLFLKQEALWKYEIYVHSNVDIPYFGLLSQTLGQDHIRYTYNMEEMLNSVTVNDQSFKKRKCKFPHETIYGSSYYYSFSSCMSDLRIFLELKQCNCTLFTSPIKFSNYFCDFRGMACISREDITFKAKQIAREKYVCYPSCSEQKLQFVGSTEIKKLDRPNFVLVDIEIQNVPSLRCVRSVTQSYQDLVVSAGGVIGLFIGISLLSVIDTIYLCLKKL